jgi:hypothetical protein
MIPVEVLAVEMSDVLLVVDLHNFVLFILQSYLQACSFGLDQIKASDIVALVLFKCFLVVHGQPAGEVYPDEFSLLIQNAEVADGHWSVLGLPAAMLEAYESSDKKSLFTTEYFLQGERLS